MKPVLGSRLGELILPEQPKFTFCQISQFTRHIVVPGDGTRVIATNEEMTINHLRLYGPMPVLSSKCLGCGAPVESPCPYCGRLNYHPKLALNVWVAGKNNGSFAAASLDGEGLELKIAIPVAKHDTLEFSTEPRAKLEIIVGGFLKEEIS